jgi:two-component system, LuxR family, sensor kinase FixL
MTTSAVPTVEAAFRPLSEDRPGVTPPAVARPFPLANGLLLFTLAALLGNEVGTLFRFPEIGAALLFPPYAALTAALVASPRRDWVWYILAGSAAHLATHWPAWSLSWVLLADVANVARALVAAGMLRWLFHGPPHLDGIRALTMFAVSAVLVAPAVGATLGAANLALHGAPPTFWHSWRAWFVSNAVTGLTIMPACLAVVADGSILRRRIAPARIAEAVVLTLALAASCALALLFDGAERWHLAVLLYAPLPVLLWAALRFGPAGTSLALTGVTLAAIMSAEGDTGPFLTSTADDRLLLLQLFVLVTALPVLCIAAVSNGRHGTVQLYRALLASLHDRVAILDARGVVLEVNDSWRRFAVAAASTSFHCAYVGDHYLSACRKAAELGDDTASRALAGVNEVLARRVQRFEMEFDDDDGEPHERYVLGVEALARHDGGAVVTLANVTARRQAQMEIEEQRHELSHLARVAVLGQLSGALAHELNQPLASIAHNAQAARHLLARDHVDLGELSAILRDIATEDERAAQVIRRLRALLKRGDMRLQSLDARELVSDVLELAHAELIARRVTANAVLAPMPTPVLGDRVQLQQVLLNLVFNACEAMSSAAVRDRRLDLSVTTEGSDNVRFSVRDWGTGIPSRLIDRLFEPFVTTKPEGLGLGLSISRSIVAAHGGRLWAVNNRDGGATVHCLLASAPQDEEAEIVRRSAVAAGRTSIMMVTER